jgi:fermentation-respiration switch protein FrsA (DUF1100 family)
MARAGGRSAQRRVPIGEIQLRRRARASRLVRAVSETARPSSSSTEAEATAAGARAHARLLARHGYGVLLYDSRGRGESEGNPNAYGWGWEKDVAGALAFLRERPEVDSGRIGGLGLSTGADVLIEVAAERKDLKAVVSDGATARSTDDIEPAPDTVQFWPLLTAVSAISGSSPGPPLEQLAARVSPTPLLLISSRRFPSERDFNARYARAAREPTQWWDADVDHVAGIRQRPQEYERRVVGWFDRALR